jgi:hypothetical protein
MHANIGHAKNAVGQIWTGARGGRIFEWVGGEWVLRYDVPRGTRAAALPWKIGEAGDA